MPVRAARVGAVVVAAAVAAGCSRFEGAVTIERRETSAPAPVVPATTPATTDAGAPSTTPAPPRLTVPEGESVVDALRLGEGGLGRARFGGSADDAVGYVASVLGRPDEDTAWDLPDTIYGPCPGTEARIVRWGWLMLVLSDRSPFGTGRRHFAGWRYGPGVDPYALYPDGLRFASGVGVGTTWGELEQLHPGVVRQPEGGRFSVGTSFTGQLDGYAPESTVVQLEAGAACLVP